MILDSVCIRSDQGVDNAVDIAWVKVEYGNVATAFIPPSPAEELLKCQEYYREISGVFNPTVYTAKLLDVAITFEPPMRVFPTLKFKNNQFNSLNGTRIGTANGAVTTGFSFTLRQTSECKNTFDVKAEKENHGFTKSNSIITVGKDNPVCLDAEIYL